MSSPPIVSLPRRVTTPPRSCDQVGLGQSRIEHEWLLILAGALSIVFGVLIVMFPPAGALALAFFVSFYAIATGVLLLALAFRARRWQKRLGGHGGYGDSTAHPSGT